jgi:hypothetical protein
METEWNRPGPWPISWSAVWVGALAALTIGLLIGLIGFAVGAHEASRAATWKNVKLITIVFSVAGAFFAFVVGGWAAGRIAGAMRAETAMLLGGLVWVLTVPLLMVAAAFGGTAHYGAWYGGLSASPAWATAAAASVPVDPNLAAATRNTALATVLALLLGLVGSVLGGWMASGEPMSLTYHRRRVLLERQRRAA